MTFFSELQHRWMFWSGAASGFRSLWVQLPEVPPPACESGLFIWPQHDVNARTQQAQRRERSKGGKEAAAKPEKIPQMRLADGCLVHLRLQIKHLSWVVQLTT